MEKHFIALKHIEQLNKNYIIKSTKNCILIGFYKKLDYTLFLRKVLREFKRVKLLIQKANIMVY